MLPEPARVAWKKRASTAERMQICAAAEKVFARPHLWSVTRSPSNEYAVLVTAPAEEMSRWEHLIQRLQREERFAQKLGLGWGQL